MSTEVRKRGRPRKVNEEMPSLAAEKIPKSTSGISRVTKPAATKVTTSTTKATSKSNGSAKQVNGKRKKIESVIAIEQDLSVLKHPAAPVAEDIPPPPVAEDIPPLPVVARLVAIESKILKEVAKTATKPKKTLPHQEEVPVIEDTTVEQVLPPLEARPPPLAAHLQPTNTLAMGLPIPTYQATSHTLGLHASKCLPWLPNPANLTQAAYLSTTTPMHASKRKLTSHLKEANRFVVAEQSSRGGPGSGAARSRAAEEGRPGLVQPGEMPAKYKPAMRRVQAIIVALPIVIVTSWMLYERLVLGVEQKKVPRLPSGADTSRSSSSSSSSES